MQHVEQELADFSVIGVNHWEAAIEVREKFSLSDQQKENLIDGALREGIESLFVVSTCNRTEIFAKDTAPEELIRLLITYSDASLDEFHRYGFEKVGRAAVDHLFQVTVGLDSQILGDLQIVNQVKEGYEFAAGKDAVSGELHRLMQHVFRAHKRSRNETSLGEGAATTAYAAVQFAMKTFDSLTDKNILLVGTGKIGKVTCKNLVSLGAKKVTLVNRTRDRAEFVADKYDLEVADYDDLPSQIDESDLIIVATGASEPVITLEDMELSRQDGRFKVMLDLSVPRNIDPEVGSLDFVDLANMDFLADVTDEAYQKREENIPLVKKIIDDEITDYQNWLSQQKVVPTIKALTSKFESIREDEFDFFKNKIKDSDRDKVENLTRRIVNKIAAYSIEHLRDHHESEQVTKVVNDMFKLETDRNHD
ncbi:glutamyl-tRNA reductase [Aliifodinibius sp. S!AR15-10]|uniref:glutamyl-tRNA reductase n=1 Tax=Aliifodinibius sp. S!AR15-10 TaxID=2950437 RepID=UPI0028624831|nr:glutamyl-tRNA reductase [Aliifodinibius sp. S!AR15-10]MDR8392475.1 glutamyl-tRNA reductase [Aliifodinibius sp. S!AR15-10]